MSVIADVVNTIQVVVFFGSLAACFVLIHVQWLFCDLRWHVSSFVARSVAICSGDLKHTIHCDIVSTFLRRSERLRKVETIPQRMVCF